MNKRRTVHEDKYIHINKKLLKTLIIKSIIIILGIILIILSLTVWFEINHLLEPMANQYCHEKLTNVGEYNVAPTSRFEYCKINYPTFELTPSFYILDLMTFLIGIIIIGMGIWYEGD